MQKYQARAALSRRSWAIRQMKVVGRHCQNSTKHPPTNVLLHSNVLKTGLQPTLQSYRYYKQIQARQIQEDTVVDSDLQHSETIGRRYLSGKTAHMCSNGTTNSPTISKRSDTNPVKDSNETASNHRLNRPRLCSCSFAIQ